WKEALHVDRSAPRTPSSKGDSLLATRVTARMPREFGTEVPLSAFYTRATATHLAHLVEDHAHGGDQSNGGCERE
ncbi:acyl carrier protein, partial [Streptomyces sp. cmx-18-6]|uniref:acyl carrier protein n=1 Tax=Streptomyces sp. cmx-18-6 TaxID=2790930 RepID=UPI0039803F5C